MNASDSLFITQQRLSDLHGQRKVGRWLMIVSGAMTAAGLLLASFHRLQWGTALNSLTIAFIGAMLHTSSAKQIHELEKSLESEKR